MHHGPLNFTVSDLVDSFSCGGLTSLYGVSTRFSVKSRGLHPNILARRALHFNPTSVLAMKRVIKALHSSHVLSVPLPL